MARLEINLQELEEKDKERQARVARAVEQGVRLVARPLPPLGLPGAVHRPIHRIPMPRNFLHGAGRGLGRCLEACDDRFHLG
jgi:hypothetical protein